MFIASLYVFHELETWHVPRLVIMLKNVLTSADIDNNVSAKLTTKFEHVAKFNFLPMS